MNNNMFSDGLKKILLVGIGAMATTTEKCMEIVDELVKIKYIPYLVASLTNSVNLSTYLSYNSTNTSK